ncbi:hypothetical protein CMV_025406 [Castanea mollissima]|uniref:Bulb-type lectin domain-containing protein n=1 Tax=Castanea mollissima TaxID=60419 RepID=A0A8J4QCP1_9ROSI|nr:hypothetical protein CMV_025406 [Castanea mollissima]
MASISFVLLVLSITFAVGRAQAKQSNPITMGSSIFPTTHPTSWLSPANLFAFGFYQQGSGFSVGIWLVGMDNKTVVWTANRDDPPVTSKAKLEFTKDGKLLLITEQGQKQLINSSTTNSVSHAAMLDSGNFVLYNEDSKFIWQSFDNPTDTILGGQTLFTGGQLLSSSSESDHSTGRYHLVMQDDGNLVSYPANSGDAVSDAYWSTDTYSGNGFNIHLYLNASGSLILVNESNLETVHSIYPLPYSSSTSSINLNNNNNNTIYRATLDAVGIFRLYSHTYDESGNDRVSPLWTALESPCKVPGFCGFNSYCTQDDEQSYCRCLPGHDFVDPNRRTLGCERHFSEAGCRGGKENAVSYNMNTMDNMMWGNIPYFAASMSMEECSSSCLEDCNCGAALFKNNYCQRQQFPLGYVRRDIKDGYTALLKMGLHSIKPLPPVVSNTVVITSKIAKLQIVLLTSGFTILSCLALATFGRFILKIRVLNYKRMLRNGNLGLPEELTLRLFTKNIDVNASAAEEIVLSSWAYKCFAARDLYKLVIGEEVDMMSLEKMVKVGLWCIQEEPALRPSMKNVVLMLEEPGAPTTLNRRRFFSSNPTRRRRSLAYYLPIGCALISTPTRRRFISSRTTRRRFFSSILNRRRHPQSSGELAGMYSIQVGIKSSAFR